MTTGRRSPAVLALAGLIALGVLAGAGCLAYLLLRGAPPPAVGLATGSPGASVPASGGSVPIGSAAARGTIGPGGADGTWTVDTTIGSFSDFSSSFVGYRVDETLASNKANTAVGRTPQVTAPTGGAPGHQGLGWSAALRDGSVRPAADAEGRG